MKRYSPGGCICCETCAIFDVDFRDSFFPAFGKLLNASDVEVTPSTEPTATGFALPAGYSLVLTKVFPTHGFRFWSWLPDASNDNAGNEADETLEFDITYTIGDYSIRTHCTDYTIPGTFINDPTVLKHNQTLTLPTEMIVTTGAFTWSQEFPRRLVPGFAIFREGMGVYKIPDPSNPSATLLTPSPVGEYAHEYYLATADKSIWDNTNFSTADIGLSWAFDLDVVITGGTEWKLKNNSADPILIAKVFAEKIQDVEADVPRTVRHPACPPQDFISQVDLPRIDPLWTLDLTTVDQDSPFLDNSTRDSDTFYLTPRDPVLNPAYPNLGIEWHIWTEDGTAKIDYDDGFGSNQLVYEKISFSQDELRRFDQTYMLAHFAPWVEQLRIDITRLNPTQVAIDLVADISVPVVSSEESAGGLFVQSLANTLAPNAAPVDQIGHPHNTRTINWHGPSPDIGPARAYDYSGTETIVAHNSATLTDTMTWIPPSRTTHTITYDQKTVSVWDPRSPPTLVYLASEAQSAPTFRTVTGITSPVNSGNVAEQTTLDDATPGFYFLINGTNYIGRTLLDYVDRITSGSGLTRGSDILPATFGDDTIEVGFTIYPVPAA